MRRLTLTLAATLMISGLFSNAARADAVEDGYRLCASLERSGLLTECEVHGWGSTIDIRIDTTSSEARKMCKMISDAGRNASFNGAWKLKILSPYSGDKPIAVCTLY